ncbi:MAG: citrate lyase subunit beta/citryl-CoA lyase [Halioglobus sp.]|jgi:citrate lyase subunit beta/citryl-CoA lyase
MIAKPFKSLLFVPASRLDMARSAHQRHADAVILDLEDGVSESDKPTARATLKSLLEHLEQRGVAVMVRINSLGTGGMLDIEALSKTDTPPLLLPKVTEPEQLLAVEECWQANGQKLSALQLLPMIECPRGLFKAEQIATATPRVSAMVFGSEDFAAEAGLSTDIEALATPAQWVALAAAAAGIPAYGLPGSLGNYRDMTLFETTLRRAKVMGFSGSLCVHPKQVLCANEIFKPSEKEIKWAQTVIAQAGDGGATGGDTGMIDAPVLARARAILNRCE